MRKGKVYALGCPRCGVPTEAGTCENDDCVVFLRDRVANLESRVESIEAKCDFLRDRVRALEAPVGEDQ